jgi:hypothetical protein
MDASNDSFTNETFDYGDFNGLTQSTISYFTFILLGIFGNMICFLGLLGNILSIIVLSKPKMQKLSSYRYLLWLSICDAIGLLFTLVVFFQYTIKPGQIIPLWKNGVYQYILLYVYPIVTTTQLLSVWIVFVFTIDRYFYVCKPYFGKSKS